ncbi:YybH family protein [Microbacterium sp. LBN7]|uniref:YybH family protein n=1 Tax=Microbacterium sp. LBN7 TaxID=3129773 RepID=UPI003246380F
MTAQTTAAAARIAPALTRWQQGIGAGDLDRIASAFTTDALFQGLRPEHSIGRAGVVEYYASQPVPLTVEYDVLRAHDLGDDAVVAYLGAVFHLEGREDVATHLTLVFDHSADDLLISHYHVSRVN